MTDPVHPYTAMPAKELSPQQKVWLRGFRTFAVGLFWMLVPTFLTYVMKFDWAQYVPPAVALGISGFSMVLLRYLTTGPAGFTRSTMRPMGSKF